MGFHWLSGKQYPSQRRKVKGYEEHPFFQEIFGSQNFIEIHHSRKIVAIYLHNPNNNSRLYYKLKEIH